MSDGPGQRSASVGSLEAVLAALRLRLSEPLLARLPDQGGAGDLSAWVEQLGEELGPALAALPPEQLAVAIEACVALGASGVAPLRRAAAEAGDKATRRALRRALHRLRSSGVDAEPPRESSGSVLERRGAAREQERALVTAIDPLGTRLAVLECPQRTRVVIYELVLSDTRGLIRLDRFELRRADARRLHRELAARGERLMTPIPAPALRGLVRAAEATRQGAPAPEVDSGATAELLAGEAGPRPGERVRAELASDRLDAAKAEAVLAERLERGALALWLPELAPLREAALRMGEAERSPLVLSAMQTEERRAELLAAEAELLLDARMRERIAARLEESAYLWRERGDEEGARAAVSVADRVREAADPLQVPYLRRLLQAALDHARRGLAEEEKGNLIVPG